MFVGREQGFEARLRGGVAFTHHFEKCGALLRRFLQRQGKQDFFAVWIHWGNHRAGGASLAVRLGQGDALDLE